MPWRLFFVLVNERPRPFWSAVSERFKFFPALFIVGHEEMLNFSEQRFVQILERFDVAMCV